MTTFPKTEQPAIPTGVTDLTPQPRAGIIETTRSGRLRRPASAAPSCPLPSPEAQATMDQRRYDPCFSAPSDSITIHDHASLIRGPRGTKSLDHSSFLDHIGKDRSGTTRHARRSCADSSVRSHRQRDEQHDGHRHPDDPSPMRGAAHQEQPRQRKEPGATHRYIDHHMEHAGVPMRRSGVEDAEDVQPMLVSSVSMIPMSMVTEQHRDAHDE